MNILFLNTGYLPTHDEWIRLDNIQREIAGWRAELAREWQLKRFAPGEIYLSKERFHNGIRQNWRIFQGLKEDNTKLLYISKES